MLHNYTAKMVFSFYFCAGLYLCSESEVFLFIYFSSFFLLFFFFFLSFFFKYFFNYFIFVIVISCTKIYILLPFYFCHFIFFHFVL